jgi:hypothetical protein
MVDTLRSYRIIIFGTLGTRERRNRKQSRKIRFLSFHHFNKEENKCLESLYSVFLHC